MKYLHHMLVVGEEMGSTQPGRRSLGTLEIPVSEINLDNFRVQGNPVLFKQRLGCKVPIGYREKVTKMAL